MQSARDSFETLRQRLGQSRNFDPTGFDPVYYLIFHPQEILEVKRLLPAWKARLQNDGWQPHQLSLAHEIADILASTPLRRLWLAADRRAPLDWSRTNHSLANLLSRGALQDRLKAKLDQLQGQPNTLLLVTDLEALHPYLRIGAIEGQLIGSFHIPTIFLYPGVRTGESRLKFLGFYPEDGNYRSVHIGG